MTQYLIVFAVAAIVSYVATPPVRLLATRMGAIAVPSDRKVHLEPTPQWGGLAMYAALVGGIGVAWLMPGFRDLFNTSSEPIGILVAATAILPLGMMDDIRDLKAPTKLGGQLLAAGILVLGGVQIFYVWLPGVGVIALSSDLSAIVTVLWTVAVMNAINLIDGLDGLAVGVTTISAIAFFIYAVATSEGPTTAALIMAIVAGSGIGFLRHNFHPARIFIGDTGAYFLGLLLASATVSGISRTTEPQFIDVAGFFVPVLLPVLVLGIPLADASFAIMRRVRGRRPVFHADKEHIHHWLLGMASSYRQAVLVMYLWSALLAAATLTLALGPGIVWRFVAGGIAFLWLATVIVLPRIMRRGQVGANDIAVIASGGAGKAG